MEELGGSSVGPTRQTWGRQVEFVLTCIGFAVGLGTVWRFPYLALKSGGGAFLIPLFIMFAVVGLPVFYLELSLGQFASLGPTAIWKVSPALKGLGWAMVVTSWLIALYYNVVICYCVYYFIASMGPDLPWASCDHAWNSRFCVTPMQIRNISNETLSKRQWTSCVWFTWLRLHTILSELNISRSQLTTPAEEYFFNKVLDLSDGIDHTGEPVWQLVLCLFLSWLIIFCVLIKGTASLGKVVYFTAIFPYIMMLVLLIRGLTLDGAIKGILYYLSPNASRLQDTRVWYGAATQIFFALNTCTGGLIAMASYNKFNNNCLRDAMVVCLTTCFTCIFSGLVVFSVLGFMAHAKGVDICDVAREGPGLIFIAYPEALAQMPLPTLWSLLFFFMLVTLGLSSQFPTMETLYVSILDEFPHLRRSPKITMAVRALCTLLSFLFCLPMVTRGGFYWFDLTDQYASGFPLLTIGVVEIVAIVWVYGYDNFAEDIALMHGEKPNLYFKTMWYCITPAILVAIIILKAKSYRPPTLGKYTYPAWAESVGWLMVAFCLIWIPVVFIWRLFKEGLGQVIRRATIPKEDWGPALSKNRIGKYASKYPRNLMLNAQVSSKKP